MSTDIPPLPSDNLPIYFQLFEKPGPKTESLIAEIKRQATSLDVDGSVSLQGVFSSENSNVIIYQVDVTNKMKLVEQQNVVAFLGQIFKRFSNKFPSYVEAAVLEQHWGER